MQVSKDGGLKPSWDGDPVRATGGTVVLEGVHVAGASHPYSCPHYRLS